MSKIELVVSAGDISIKGQRYGRITAVMEDVDTDEIFDQVEITDILRRFDPADLMDEIGVKDVQAWLENEGYAVTEE